MVKIYDVVVIGVGPGGLTSALYASRANLSVLVLGMEIGGQLMDTDVVENYTGVGEITGPKLADAMYEDAMRYGAKHEIDLVAEVTTHRNVKYIKTIMGNTYMARTIIVATGTKYKSLGVDGEEKFKGRGISSCFTCDAAFFKDKKVAVVGGGDTAVEGAMYLTEYTDKVTLIHRRDKLRAEPINQDRLEDNGNINIVWNSEVTSVIGDATVEKLTILDRETKETTEEAYDGLFVAIGSNPEISFLDKLELEVDFEGYIKVNDLMESSVEGVYAVGDVTTTPLKQISTAVGEGSVAGQQVYEYLLTFRD